MQSISVPFKLTYGVIRFISGRITFYFNILQKVPC